MGELRSTIRQVKMWFPGACPSCRIRVLMALVMISVTMCIACLSVFGYKDQPVNSQPSDCSSRNGSQWKEIIFHQFVIDFMAEESQKRASWFLNQYVSRNLNSDIVYRGWLAEDRERFIRQEYPWFYQTYKSYPYEIQRIDAAKYFVMYHFGGVYLDMDIRCRIGLRRVIDKEKLGDHVMLVDSVEYGLRADVLFSPRHHPFFAYVIQRLDSYNQWYGIPYFTVLMSTGPLFLTQAYNSYRCKNQIKIIDNWKFAGKTKQSYFFPTTGESWQRIDGIIMLFIGRYWWKLPLFLLALFVLRYVLLKYVIQKPIHVRTL